MLEHQVVAVLAQQLPVDHAHGPEHVHIRQCRGGVVLLGRRGEDLGRPVEDSLHRGQEQLALAPEQGEYVWLGHTDASSYPVNRRPVQAAAGELVHGALNQRVLSKHRMNVSR